jgi:hypothetical protein
VKHLNRCLIKEDIPNQMVNIKWASNHIKGYSIITLIQSLFYLMSNESLLIREFQKWCATLHVSEWLRSKTLTVSVLPRIQYDSNPQSLLLGMQNDTVTLKNNWQFLAKVHCCKIQQFWSFTFIQLKWIIYVNTIKLHMVVYIRFAPNCQRLQETITFSKVNG